MVLLLFTLSVSFAMPNHVYAEESDFLVTKDGVLNRYIGTGENVVIPEEVNGIKITSIGNSAFYCSPTLTSVDIPNSITSIGNSAFYGCDRLTSIDIPNSVTSIDEHAFDSCDNLTAIKISNSVTSIKYATFYGCNSLTSINIPNSVTSIEQSAFYNCTNLTNIEIPDSVTSIGIRAFYNCTSLKTVNIPNTVTSIMAATFYGCNSLTSVDIPNSVTSIGQYAFADCTSLTNIEIPNSVTSIGEDTFYNCTNLNTIVINNDNITLGANLANPNKVTLCGNKNSTTEQYAKENGYKFRLIGEIPLTGISLQKTDINIKVGKTSLNSVIFNPIDTTDDKTVKWTSSNPEIVHVYSTGKVKGISKGTAIITAQVGEFTTTCTVTVN